jgi:hypothetical protein
MVTRKCAFPVKVSQGKCQSAGKRENIYFVDAQVSCSFDFEAQERREIQFFHRAFRPEGLLDLLALTTRRC